MAYLRLSGFKGKPTLVGITPTNQLGFIGNEVTMNTSHNNEKAQENTLPFIGKRLLESGIKEFKHADQATQKLAGATMTAAGTVMYGAGRVLGFVGPHIQRGAILAADKLVENRVISEDSKAPVAIALTVGGGLLVLPVGAAMADDVAEVALASIWTLVN